MNNVQFYTKKTLRMKKKSQGDSKLTHDKIQMQKYETHEQRQALTKAAPADSSADRELGCGSYCANHAD